LKTSNKHEEGNEWRKGALLGESLPTS
jgi:hypothetical protein